MDSTSLFELLFGLAQRLQLPCLRGVIVGDRVPLRVEGHVVLHVGSLRSLWAETPHSLDCRPDLWLATGHEEYEEAL